MKRISGPLESQKRNPVYGFQNSKIKIETVKPYSGMSLPELHNASLVGRRKEKSTWKSGLFKSLLATRNEKRKTYINSQNKILNTFSSGSGIPSLSSGSGIPILSSGSGIPILSSGSGIPILSILPKARTEVKLRQHEIAKAVKTFITHHVWDINLCRI